MKAKLFCKTGQLAGSEFQIGSRVTIGSKPENDIVLYPNVISGNHAQISFDEDRKSYYLEDLNSRNGTKLDGMRVTRKEKLDKLHVITFAKVFEFIFQVLDVSPRPKEGDVEVAQVKPEAQIHQTKFDPEPVQLPQILEEGKPQETRQELEVDTAKTRFDDEIITPPDIAKEQDAGEEKSAVAEADKTKMGDEFLPLPRISESENIDSDVVRNSKANETTFDADFIQIPELKAEKTREESPVHETPQLILEFTNLDDESKTFKLKEGEYVIGRSAQCEIHIDDPSISRKHARVTVSSNKVKIKDLESKNHTFLDDKEMEAEFEVEPDAIIKFGKVEAKLLSK